MEITISHLIIVTACASGSIWRIAGEGALLQAGVLVPVLAMTNRGKELIIEKIRLSDEQVLIKPTKLPTSGGTLSELLI